MTIRRLFLPPAGIALNGVIGLFLVVWAANGDWAQAGQPAGAEVGRRRIPLTDGWLVKQLDSEKPDDPRAAKHKSLRKCHSDFGSYLGATPHAVKVGVYRDVVLDLPEEAWIEDVCVRPVLSPDFRSASVQVSVETAGESGSLEWTLVDPAGREVSRGQRDTSAAGTEFEIAVSEPKLWWPRMQGEQNIYTLEVSLRAGERVVDRRRTTFGIREVKPVLSDPETGQRRFRFDVNGRPVFLRGGDWVPVEGATHVWQPDRARRLLDLAEQGNMNILRIWGNIVWRLNDSWPMIYSSVVDYYLQPKIAYCFLRRAYEPVLASFEKTQDRICVWVVNDSPQPVQGTLVVERLDFDGKNRGKLQAEVAVPPGQSKRCLDLTGLGEISLRSEFLRASFSGREATYLLIGERYLHLPQAHLTVRKQNGRIEIATDVFARQVELRFDGIAEAVFDDNCFDLAPGQKRTIAVAGEAVGRNLEVRALNANPVSIRFRP